MSKYFRWFLFLVLLGAEAWFLIYMTAVIVFVWGMDGFFGSPGKELAVGYALITTLVVYAVTTLAYRKVKS